MDILEDKKAEDIVLLDVRVIASFTDFFIICSGGSDRTVQALADVVQEKARELANRRGRVEGQPRDGWVLVDFGDLIVHVFSPDQRAFYRIEELWHEGKTLLRVQ
ncbi:MAG: ribosome silencing factor [Anaerolineales bacterium]